MSYYSQPPMMPMGGMSGMPMPMGGMPMGSMPGSAYGTPYPGNALMMNGVGSEYGAPYVEGYPPTITRTRSLHAPSIYEDERDLYDRERGYYDRGYERDYYDDYERGRRYDSDYERGGRYDNEYYPSRRSSSRASRRSRRDYDDYGYGYNDDYYHDPRYRSSSRYRGGSSRDYYDYPSSSRHYSSSSRSGRKREELSIINKRNGEVKVLRDGQERMGDRVRRMFGLDPKGVNIVRVKKGEHLAAHISR